MHAIWWMLTALAVLALAYRYYSAFLAARVLALDESRQTPAYRYEDGQNFHPTNKWVLFGHHFAAISGAGPLIGPVLAAQFGFLPGFLWILFGVVIAGAVQDFVILVGSVRHEGKSLAEIARDELGPGIGTVTGVAILFILVVALAGLGRVVVEALAESSWGVFTIGSSVPIALGMGLYIYKLRGGTDRAIREATIAGVVLLLLALVAGKSVQDGPLGETLRLSPTALTASIAAYGFIASVLPVWMLLCPRDYLSSYLKIGTIFLLIAGILVVNPEIHMPLVNEVLDQGKIQVGADTFGRVVPGKVFPFVFITIACGAISGFHSLVASGTTPKMVKRETDCRAIGYGAMLMEGLVAITALIAASTLPPPDYFAINTDPPVALVAGPDHRGLARSPADLAALDAPGVLDAHDRALLGLKPGQTAASLAAPPAGAPPAAAGAPPAAAGAPPAGAPPATLKASQALHLSNRALSTLGYSADPHAAHASELTEADLLRLGIRVTDLPGLSREANEVVAARTGGAVSLAIGMARIFSGLPGMRVLLSYWYHFAIMFEALFILTTIDSGTRIARFVLQEFIGRHVPRFADPSWKPGALISTGLIVGGWSYFILTGSIGTIWPMFGVANQLLAMTALCVGTTMILRQAARPAHALVTLIPLCFVGTTTTTAGVQALFLIYLPMTRNPATATVGRINAFVIASLLVCVCLVLAGSIRKWMELLSARRALA
jgi:carbon starvation protein